jgi:hypothetical protein
LTAPTLTAPAAASRFMGQYAKRFHAGAFAVPTAAEIAAMQRAGTWLEFPGGLAAAKILSRHSIRRDFTGRAYVLPHGTPVVTHIAAEPGAALPDLRRYGAVYAYVEDPHVTAALRDQGFAVLAVRVSAASELIAAWTPGDPHAYPEEEAATIRRVPLPPINPARARAVEREVAALRGWTDDFPFYSDGSWAALNLRGFKPDDPTWGVKPAEMSKAWHADNPGAHALRCDWTTLARVVPSTASYVASMGLGDLERVRLLQMAGRGGRGGRLSRHSDVTDRAAGVADGKIARFHIPVVTDPAITMTGWNLEGRSAAVHLPPWSMWYLDARKPHAVDNPTGVDRVHLVIDVVSNPRVRDLIRSGTEHVQ